MSLTYDEQMVLDDILFVFAIFCIIGYLLMMIAVLLGYAEMLEFI
jgi:hypothetical protein